MRVLALYSIKGGVGKTAAAVNLAYLSAVGGARTLLWDLDPQGAASFYFRVEAKVKGGARGLIRDQRRAGRGIRGTDFEDLDLLPADFSYRNLDLRLHETKKPTQRLAELLGRFEGRYDTLFLDSAPSISLTSEALFVAADVLLVPTIPTPLSLRTLSQLVAHLEGRARAPRILPFFTMVDRRKALHRSVAAAEEHAGIPFLRHSIPYSSLVESMGLERQPLISSAPHSPPSRAYQALWEEILERLC